MELNMTIKSFWKFILLLGILLISTPSSDAAVISSLDFQLLLDPQDTQDNIDRFDKLIDMAQNKKILWTYELQNVENLRTSMESKFTLDVPHPGSGVTADYKGILGDFEQIRYCKEREEELKKNINASTEFIQTGKILKILLEKGIESDKSFLHFSEIREIMRKLWELSHIIFTSSDEKEELGTVCMKILIIQKPTIDELKSKDYNSICFNY